MECRNCNTRLKEGAKFCQACGMPANKPIIRYEDYDKCRDIFSDSSMLPEKETEIYSVAEQNYSDRISTSIHSKTSVNQPVKELVATDGILKTPYGAFDDQYGLGRSAAPQPANEGNIQEEIKIKKEKKQKTVRENKSSLLDKPLKRIIIDMTAVFMGVVVIAAAILLAVNYISESSKAEADSDTAEYYELETGELSSDDAKQIDYVMKNPEVLDIIDGGISCEGKRYAVSGKITQVEKYESFAAIKINCEVDGVEFTALANFEESNLKDAKKLRMGQEACITGVLDLQNVNDTCVVYLNYAKSDL